MPIRACFRSTRYMKNPSLRVIGTSWKRSVSTAAVSALSLLALGCESAGIYTAAGAVGVTIGGHEESGASFEQVYYLGSFDPYGQFDPSLYRVRVRGDTSALAQMKYASGWVPAIAVDSLGTSLALQKDGRVKFQKSEELLGDEDVFLEGRKMVMFGPEGFREVPEDHRLVIMMNSDPTDFFKAVQDVLGYIRAVTTESNTIDGDVQRAWLEAKLAAEQDLAALLKTFPEQKLENQSSDQAQGGN